MLALRRRALALFLSDDGPMLETLDYTIRIGSTPTILYFDLYLYFAYAAHYVYITKGAVLATTKELEIILQFIG